MFENDPCTFTLKCIGNKWKAHILWELRSSEPARFGVMLKRFPITERVLSQNLKELVSDGLVQRCVYAEVPPRVEYSITELGSTVLPIISAIYQWGRLRMLENGLRPDSIGEMRFGYTPGNQNMMEDPRLFCSIEGETE